MYRIFITEEFDRCVEKIGKREKTAIEKKLLNYIAPQLKKEPHFGNNIKKLKNFSPETWRYKTGNYRLFYLIEEAEKIVKIISIDHRKNAY